MATGSLQRRLDTGVDGLDRGKRIGGIPAGSTIGVLAPPLSMANLLGYHLFETGRETTYVSTGRRAADVERDVETTIGGAIDEDSRVVDVRGDLAALPDPIAEHLGTIEEGGNFVLDTATALHGRDGYPATVRAIQEATYDRRGLSYLVFSVPNVQALSRQEAELLHALDGIFVVSHNPTPQELETFLHIHKLRRGEPKQDAFKLRFDRRVSIDASKNY